MSITCRSAALVAALAFAGAAAAVDESARAIVPVRHALTSPPSGVTELRFGQVFKRPAGPLGLELTPEFVALDGRVVRIVGYRAVSSDPDPAGFVLAPFPVSLGGEDESLADDLPPSALYVRATTDDARRASWLIAVTGVLRVEATRAPDGRILPARIETRADESSITTR